MSVVNICFKSAKNISVLFVPEFYLLERRKRNKRQKEKRDRSPIGSLPKFLPHLIRGQTRARMQ